jgi:hypothetical protein
MARGSVFGWLTLGTALAVVFTALAAQADDRGEGRHSRPVACPDLTAFTSEGNTTITSATLVTSGSRRRICGSDRLRDGWVP